MESQIPEIYLQVNSHKPSLGVHRKDWRQRGGPDSVCMRAMISCWQTSMAPSSSPNPPFIGNKRLKLLDMWVANFLILRTHAKIHCYWNRDFSKDCPWRKGRKPFGACNITPILRRGLLSLEKGQAPDSRDPSCIIDMRALWKAANETETLKNLLQYSILALAHSKNITLLEELEPYATLKTIIETKKSKLSSTPD